MKLGIKWKVGILFFISHEKVLNGTAFYDFYNLDRAFN